MKKIKEISSPNLNDLLDDCLEFSRSFEDVSILNSNNYPDQYGKYHLLAAFGAKRKIVSSLDSFKKLDAFLRESESWAFGHLSYDLKNEVESLESGNKCLFDLPYLHFYEPKHLLLWKRDQLHAEWWSSEEDELMEQLDNIQHPLKGEFAFPAFQAGFSKEEYLKRVEKLKEEIRYGNIYEVNFCQQFTAEGKIDPVRAYQYLNMRSPMPFSAFYRFNRNYLLCASPERFMAKRSNKLICQPIKGTAKRSPDPKEDQQIKNELRNDLKEQTENVMIVDLMRNDLSRSAKRNSVRVDELFGVYSFPQVHQLISTVSSELAEEYSSVDAIKWAFPMGSMTGAPKIKAMQLIDKWENAARELYSGSVGYFDPDGDFDLNVVIRSVLHHSEKEISALTVGGAITDLADPESEYKECLLKAKAIFETDESN